MLFNSINFLFFFIIVTTAYFVLPHKYRWVLLLASSCYFYMSFIPVYILILAFTIIVDYIAGIAIENSEGRKKRLFLVVGLLVNILMLAFFKYYNFLNDNLTTLLYGIGFENPIPNLSIILPIGLSFHTFQAMSYIIEVNRGRYKAERHFGIFSVYVMFYPQLVAGPIERPQNLLHQFYDEHHFEYKNLSEGLKLMVWGLFKKIVIADRLAIFVNAVYNNQEYHTGLTFFVATLFFAVQIYCDFSGYSDIAIGAARVMGFKLINNFNFPYFSKTISEFWSKWHISLSNWLRDYIYLPIIGSTSRKMKKPRYLSVKREIWIYSIATVITFITSGIWHGAAWTFVLLGVVHAFYLVFAITTKNIRLKIAKFVGLTKVPALFNGIQIITTILLVSFGYIFFRANSFTDAMSIIKKIFTFKGPLFIDKPSTMIMCIFGILFISLIEIKKVYYQGSFSFSNNQNWLIRYLSYATLIICILLIGVFDGGQFIYFQF
jgi:alginate O-acetyltransferase complex protein AlgI